MLQLPHVLVQQAIRDDAFAGNPGRPPLRDQALPSLHLSGRWCPSSVLRPGKPCRWQPRFPTRRPPLCRLHVGPATSCQRPKPSATGVTARLASLRRRSMRASKQHPRHKTHRPHTALAHQTQTPAAANTGAHTATRSTDDQPVVSPHHRRHASRPTGHRLRRRGSAGVTADSGSLARSHVAAESTAPQV